MKYKKDIQYKKEQDSVIEKLLEILELKDNNNFILYEVEHNEDKINKISDLMPDVKKYFPCNLIGGIKQSDKLLRPWLSVVKQLLKRKYKLVSSDYRIKENDKVIRTRVIHLLEKIDK